MFPLMWSLKTIGTQNTEKYRCRILILKMVGWRHCYSKSLLRFTGCLACDLGGRPPWASMVKLIISMHACFFPFPLEMPCTPSFSCNRRLFPGPTLQCLCGQCHWHQHHHFLGAHQLSTKEQCIHQSSGGYHRHYVGC